MSPNAARARRLPVDPEVDRRIGAAAAIDGIGEPELPIELERPRLHGERRATWFQAGAPCR